MDRLTEYQPTEGGIPYVVPSNTDPRYGDPMQDILQRLADYEDTGLEPDAFQKLSDAIGGKTGADAGCWCACGDALQLEIDDDGELTVGCFGCHKFVKVSELMRLYEFMEEGRLIVLPYKVRYEGWMK